MTSGIDLHKFIKRQWKALLGKVGLPHTRWSGLADQAFDVWMWDAGQGQVWRLLPCQCWTNNSQCLLLATSLKACLQSFARVYKEATTTKSPATSSLLNWRMILSATKTKLIWMHYSRMNTKSLSTHAGPMLKDFHSLTVGLTPTFQIYVCILFRILNWWSLKHSESLSQRVELALMSGELKRDLSSAQLRIKQKETWASQPRETLFVISISVKISLG